MTRKESYAFYEELKKTGKLKEFQRKRPSETTKKEQDLFYYDDGEVMYNLFAGVLSEIVKGSSELGSPLTEEKKKKSIRFIPRYENKVIFRDDT